ncbi:MAG: hypothetical protein V4696_03755 [Pseudomonadota bacterium]
MPVVTATPARIRRSRRDAEYARVTNAGILTLNPIAADGFADVQETFFDSTDDAQVLLTEKSTYLMAHRVHLGIEAAASFGMGSAIAISPTLPKARVLDREAELDRNLMVKGMARDLHTDRDSLELIG